MIFFILRLGLLCLTIDQWYSGFALIDFLRDVGKHFRLGTMLAKESVKSRLNSEEGISFTELSHHKGRTTQCPTNDSYHLNVQSQDELFKPMQCTMQ